ncbi:MAG TPA: hypothetical protein VFE14_17885 [Micromonosporaceae bacterium]|nr:hypothetical protein [Micromonosporaceae bacterium]
MRTAAEVKSLPHVNAGLAASGVLAVLAAVVGYAMRGPSSAAGAVAGVALVAASYTISSVVLAWAASVNPRLLLTVGLGTYVVKFTLIGVVMAAIASTGWAGLPAMGVAIMAAVVAWSGSQIWWVTHLPS